MLSQIAALKATKIHMQTQIDRVAQNGYFSTSWSIRQSPFDGKDLSPSIVPIVTKEFIKEGYTVIEQDYSLTIKWDNID